VKVLVIGAGVLGASVACRLAQAGAAVTVLEARWVGGGTSSASFAWTNANNKPPRAYHDLNVEGMRAHAALREEFGGAPWWHAGGNLQWAVDDASQRALRERVERLRAWGYAVAEIGPRELRDLEPDIAPAAVEGAAIAYYPEEGWLDPVVYAHAMIEEAVRRGARLSTGVRVRALRRDGRRVLGVTTDDGTAHDADVVVNCAGRWSSEVAATARLDIPLAPTAGLLALTPPVPSCLRRIVHAPSCHLRPDGGGRLMVQADDTDDAVTAQTASRDALPAARDLLRRAARLLPGIAGAEPEAVRIGVRPYPADGVSAVGPHPEVDGYYLVVTHSGVTLSPFLGRVVAGEILSGRPDPRLAPFRPARFLRTG
jgi:glycine/D-amino acid oxidase-like deaminating enzyme